MQFALKWTHRALLFVAATATSPLGCSFPDHRFSDEDCFNGVDDDSNGLADCDDPACQPVLACVPAIPTESGWQGPVTIWQGAGAESPPSCANSEYPQLQFQQLFSGPSAGPGTCPTCECSGTPSVQSSRCVTRVQMSDRSDCSSSQQLMTGPDGQPGFEVSTNCTAVTIGTQFTPQTTYFTAPTAISDGCVAQSTGQAVMPAPTFDKSLRACGSPDASLGGCTTSQQVCVPRPKGGFGPMVCVFQEGDPLDCPGAYDQKLVFSRYTDARRCSDCSCTPAGVACEATPSAEPAYVGVYETDSSCSSTPFQIVAQSTGCVNHTFTPGSSVYMKLVNVAPQPTSPLACQPNASSTVGDVVPAQSITFCCLTP